MKLFIPTLLLFILYSCNQVPQEQRPNIIFIMADDLGYGDLACYGQEHILSPHIDRLAGEGMRFTQCYSGAAVCAPARSVLMTGQHTGHTRVRGNFGLGGVRGLAGIEGRVPLQEEDYTLAEMLKEQGYVTGMAGKWGLGEPGTSGEPNAQGFDEFFGFLNQRRAHSYYPDYLWNNREKVLYPENQEGKGSAYTHDLFTKYALNFIRSHRKEPFFLYVPFCIPHARYEVPELGIYEEQDWEKDAQAYAAMITRMDRSVGLIMEALKEARIDENTIVFFTSDNGAAESTLEWPIFRSSGDLRGVKRDPYEGGIRVPMIVSYPGRISPGSTSDLPWYFADVLPTLGALTGSQVPGYIDGVSILPTLFGDEQKLGPRPLYWELYEMEGWRAVRFGQWKAIQHNMHHQTPADIELYNLETDLGEHSNMADEHPELVRKAEALFEKLHAPSSHYIWKNKDSNEPVQKQ